MKGKNHTGLKDQTKIITYKKKQKKKYGKRKLNDNFNKLNYNV